MKNDILLQASNMEYSLTTYNIFKLHLPLCRQYVGLLEKNNDFLLLQEWVDSLHVHDDVFTTVQPTFTIPLKNQKTGVATISHYQPLEEERYLSLSKELGLATLKSMVVTSYNLDGSTITIMNCHALNFVTNGVWSQTFDYWLSRLPESGPCIIAGDFNTWNMLRTDHIKQQLTSHGFIQATYKHPTSICLDHVWHRDIEELSCNAHLNTHTSDHYPVTLKFKLLQ